MTGKVNRYFYLFSIADKLKHFWYQKWAKMTDYLALLVVLTLLLQRLPTGSCKRSCTFRHGGYTYNIRLSHKGDKETGQDSSNCVGKDQQVLLDQEQNDYSSKIDDMERNFSFMRDAHEQRIKVTLSMLYLHLWIVYIIQPFIHSFITISVYSFTDKYSHNMLNNSSAHQSYTSRSICISIHNPLNFHLSISSKFHTSIHQLNHSRCIRLIIQPFTLINRLLTMRL